MLLSSGPEMTEFLKENMPKENHYLITESEEEFNQAQQKIVDMLNEGGSLHGHPRDNNKTHKLVIGALKVVARTRGKPLKTIKKLIIKRKYLLTAHFWEVLREMNPEHEYDDLSYCDSCDSFTLEKLGPSKKLFAV
jgi:hypothetical protein